MALSYFVLRSNKAIFPEVDGIPISRQYVTLFNPNGDLPAMCEIFAKQPKENYQTITRSIRIDGHATSVKLEASYWDILQEIADAQQLTVPKFISTVYREALEHNGEVSNFASLLRCACLMYARQPTNVIEVARQELVNRQI
ncbi:hypothetical protein VV208B2_09050 [Vibrio vulnificus]|nr:hypothetical protein VV208B2_09050 [Vibrio vulnificus]